MGKNKKSEFVFFDDAMGQSVEVDSAEEWYVYAWISEAKRIGVVVDYEYQPQAFHLTDKFKYVPAFGNPRKREKHLLADHDYTADFKIVFNGSFGERLAKYFKVPVEAVGPDGNATVYIDVKGKFNKFAGDRNFSIHQKLVWDKYRKFVQKVIPEDLFNALGAPRAAMFTIKKKAPTKKFVGTMTIEESFGVTAH